MNCKIVGYEYKTLEVILSPGESFYAERGSIVYVDEALQRDAEWNGGGSGSGLGNLIGGVLRSALSGESVLIIHFYNPTNTDRKMVLSGSMCALVPIRLQGENMICRRGHYVASTDKVKLIEKILANGETIEVDENHIVALQGFQTSQIQAGWSFGNVLKGEGLSLMKITGPGKVYMSPIPMIIPNNKN